MSSMPKLYFDKDRGQVWASYTKMKFNPDIVEVQPGQPILHGEYFVFIDCECGNDGHVVINSRTMPIGELGELLYL